MQTECEWPNSRGSGTHTKSHTEDHTYGLAHTHTHIHTIIHAPHVYAHNIVSSGTAQNIKNTHARRTNTYIYDKRIHTTTLQYTYIYMSCDSGDSGDGESHAQAYTNEKFNIIISLGSAKNEGDLARLRNGTNKSKWSQSSRYGGRSSKNSRTNTLAKLYSCYTRALARANNINTPWILAITRARTSLYCSHIHKHSHALILHICSHTNTHTLTHIQ